MGETRPATRIFRPDTARAYGTLGLIAAAALWLYWLSVTMPESNLAQALRLGIVLVTILLGLVVVQTTLNLVTRRLSVELTADALVYRDPEHHSIVRADILDADLVRDPADFDTPLHILIRYRNGADDSEMIREARLPFPYASDLPAMHRAINAWLCRPRVQSAPPRLPPMAPGPDPAPAARMMPAAPEMAAPYLAETPRPLPRIAARSVFGQKQTYSSPASLYQDRPPGTRR